MTLWLTLVPGGCESWFPLKRQLYPMLHVLSLSLFLFMLLFYLNNVSLSFTWVLTMIAVALSPGIRSLKTARWKTYIHICICTCIYVYIHTCMFMCIYISDIYLMYMYTHTLTKNTISPVLDQTWSPIPQPHPTPADSGVQTQLSPETGEGRVGPQLQLHMYQFLMACWLCHPEMRLKPNVWDPNEV